MMPAIEEIPNRSRIVPFDNVKQRDGFGRSLMYLIVCGQGFNGGNPGTILGKLIKRMESRQFEIGVDIKSGFVDFAITCSFL